MDFYKIRERSAKNGVIEVYPDFKVVRSEDLMIRSKAFYAIWDEAKGLWTTDEYDVQRLVDEDLRKHAALVQERHDGVVSVKYMKDFESNSWLHFRKYLAHLGDSSKQLDETMTFANTEVTKDDYVSRRLPYPLAEGSFEAYDEIMSTLYDPEEREKLEWAVGSIIAGDSKHIQKFMVLYGPPGAGKGTWMNIAMKIFEGYVTMFEAKALTGSSNAFSTEAFRNNPLVAMQHDGDLSKIEDNTKLNSIVSHEDMTINEKYKPSYTSRINSFLFMGTNKPVKITDAKSGIIRRLIDVQPSGRKVPEKRYHILKNQVLFELGAIAFHCLGVYRSRGRDYYSSYRPIEMMLQTDVFFNFIEDAYDIFKEQDGATLHQAYELYKQFCEDSNIEYRMPRYRFREEIKNYFKDFEERAIIDDVRVRSWYSGFITDHFKVKRKEESPVSITLDKRVSIFDGECASQPAQYANEHGTPTKRWSEVTTLMQDLDSTKIHYVKPPLNHIVIDFDLKDDTGEKSKELNLAAASKWPSTYAEFSKGGSGVHLHFIYEGDPTKLARLFDTDIEVKVFTGDSALRRRLTMCNDLPIATINSGIPLKETKVLDVQSVQTEKGLRDLIGRNLRKEIHPGTKSSVDFIAKILQDAHDSGLAYDVTDLQARILSFAAASSNQALAAIRQVKTMPFVGHIPVDATVIPPAFGTAALPPIVYFDCEVLPNLLMVNWKYKGDDKVTRMINPTPQAVEELTKFRLIGFNCRRYDNHILYARIMGHSIEQVYQLSAKLIAGERAYFGEAYGLSWVDIYDYASKKQSMAKWQVELGIHHQEMEIDWTKPFPEERWGELGDYCDNDVITTEKLDEHLEQDYNARLILSEISGLAPNETTQKHTAKIVFGSDRRPQTKFIYTDLATGGRYSYPHDPRKGNYRPGGTDTVSFPGYTFDKGKSEFMGEDPSEGGYVYEETGIHYGVAVLDVESMHPSSIIAMDAFGIEFTKKFGELLKARLAIKHGDYETAGKMFGGVLKPYLGTKDQAKKLSHALKIAVNIVYGLTSAKFENPFKDNRNVDNIVAKRGALFMIALKQFVQDHGYTVVHIKTDSIKIANADQKIIDLVMQFGRDYAYDFEHEVTYEKMVLINKAVYAGKVGWAPDPKLIGTWESTGAEFIHPVTFKTLFSNEEVVFDDLRETKSVVGGPMFLDFTSTEDIPMVFDTGTPLVFVGKTGSFVPVTERGGSLIRYMQKTDKYHAVTGTSGYSWLESEMVKTLGYEDLVDQGYYDRLVSNARASIAKFGDVDEFLKN